jgi:hypothetical protein
VFTDEQGRFIYDRVPPGQLLVTVRGVTQYVAVKPGETETISLTQPDGLPGNQPGNPWANDYPPVRGLVPGELWKGMVLQPDGTPAADTEVGLNATGAYLTIGKGVFDYANQGRLSGLIVSTGPDGRFTLPMCADEESVVAVNQKGYAQVSLEQLKQSPQIRLQPWGRIQGTLYFGHRPVTNELVAVNPQPSAGGNSQPGHPRQQISFSTSIATRTDAQGRFTIAQVPPGEVNFGRKVTLGDNSWTYTRLATLEVAPGQTIVTNIVSAARDITGKLKAGEEELMKRPGNHFACLSPGNEAGRETMASYFEGYTIAVLPDGTLQARDIPPGEYVMRLAEFNGNAFTGFKSDQLLKVPPAKDDNDTASVNWGEVALSQAIIK